MSTIFERMTSKTLTNEDRVYFENSNNVRSFEFKHRLPVSGEFERMVQNFSMLYWTSDSQNNVCEFVQLERAVRSGLFEHVKSITDREQLSLRNISKAAALAAEFGRSEIFEHLFELRPEIKTLPDLVSEIIIQAYHGGNQEVTALIPRDMFQELVNYDQLKLIGIIMHCDTHQMKSFLLDPILEDLHHLIFERSIETGNDELFFFCIEQGFRVDSDPHLAKLAAQTFSEDILEYFLEVYEEDPIELLSGAIMGQDVERVHYLASCPYLNVYPEDIEDMIRESLANMTSPKMMDLLMCFLGSFSQSTLEDFMQEAAYHGNMEMVLYFIGRGASIQNLEISHVFPTNKDFVSVLSGARIHWGRILWDAIVHEYLDIYEICLGHLEPEQVNGILGRIKVGTEAVEYLERLYQR